MTSINDKLGFKPAGKRSMMKLPKSRTEAAALTSAQCPKCTRRGVSEVTIKDLDGGTARRRYCRWCSHMWTA